MLKFGNVNLHGGDPHAHTGPGKYVVNAHGWCTGIRWVGADNGGILYD